MKMSDHDYRRLVKELKDPELIAEVLKWVEQDWPEAHRDAESNG
jgi:hypothetical protein